MGQARRRRTSTASSSPAMNRSSRSASRRRSPLSKPSSASTTAASRRNRKPLLHGAPILGCTDHRHSLVTRMRAPIRQTSVDEPGNGSRCRGRLDAQRHRKLVHRPLTMLDEEIKSVHLPQVELWFGRRPRVPAHSACRWTTAKSPPGDGNALRVVLTTARTDPAPRDESCPGGHVALRCATHHLIP